MPKCKLIDEKVWLKWRRNWCKDYCWNGNGIDGKVGLLRDWWKYTAETEAGLIQNVTEMEARLMKNILLWWENIAEIKADWRKILVNESGIFYKINIIFRAELSATNCRAEMSNAELSAPICPRRIAKFEILRNALCEIEADNDFICIDC